MAIPKKIFQTYVTQDVPQLVREEIDSFMGLNPDFDYVLFTDEDMDSYVNDTFDSDITSCYNRLNIAAAKADFWRYLVLYKEGGVYLDIDATILVPLSTFIDDEDEAIISAETWKNLYVQWALMFDKDHPILERVIHVVLRNVKHNNYSSVHATTGPRAFSQAVNAVHSSNFGAKPYWEDMNADTDCRHSCDTFSYRFYGKKWNGVLQHKFPGHKCLYENISDWRKDQKEVSLLVDE